MSEANNLQDNPDSDRFTFYEGGPARICHTDHGHKTLSIDFAGGVFDADVVRKAITDSGEHWVNLHICRVAADSQENREVIEYVETSE